MTRFLISKMAGRSESARLLVFNYHNIIASDTPSYARGLDVDAFERQIDWLHAHYDLQPLDTAVERCRSGSLERATACITFDDGYKTQATAAAVYLRKKAVPATFFVTSGHLDNAPLWNDWLQIFFCVADERERATFAELLENAAAQNSETIDPWNRRALENTFKYLSLDARRPLLDYIRTVVPDDFERQRMMSRDDIVRLHSDGFEIGAHSLSHPILKKEGAKTASEQIAVDIDNVSAIIGERVRSFAFPNGKPGIDFDEEHILMLARNRISFGLSSAFGHFSAGLDPMQISRVSLRGSSQTGFLRSVRQAYYSDPPMVTSRGYESRG